MERAGALPPTTREATTIRHLANLNRPTRELDKARDADNNVVRVGDKIDVGLGNGRTTTITRIYQEPAAEGWEPIAAEVTHTMIGAVIVKLVHKVD